MDIVEAVIDTLSELGSSTNRSLIWHLENKGISLDPQNFVLQHFYQGLEELLGNGADMLMQKVYENLRKRLSVDPGPLVGLSAVDRIEKIISMKDGGQKE